MTLVTPVSKKLVPPLMPMMPTCHCTVGVGLPLAAAVKVAVCPAVTVWLTGLVVTTGTVLTVSVAAVLVAVPRLLVKTARYWLPFWVVVTLVRVSAVLVAPEMLANVLPPLVLTCHCTVGLGSPLAAAVNVPVCPAVTAWLAGLVVTAGTVAVTGVFVRLYVALPAPVSAVTV